MQKSAMRDHMSAPDLAWPAVGTALSGGYRSNHAAALPGNEESPSITTNARASPKTKPCSALGSHVRRPDLESAENNCQSPLAAQSVKTKNTMIVRAWSPVLGSFRFDLASSGRVMFGQINGCAQQRQNMPTSTAVSARK